MLLLYYEPRSTELEQGIFDITLHVLNQLWYVWYVGDMPNDSLVTWPHIYKSIIILPHLQYIKNNFLTKQMQI